MKDSDWDFRHFTRQVDVTKDFNRIEDIFQVSIICEDIIVEYRDADDEAHETIVGRIYPQISKFVENKKTI